MSDFLQERAIELEGAGCPPCGRGGCGSSGLAAGAGAQPKVLGRTRVVLLQMSAQDQACCCMPRCTDLGPSWSCTMPRSMG